MKKTSILGLAGSLLILLGLHAAPAFAQATRTWVSGVGDDANPCSRTAPCKTFAGAISKTAAGGIINCLDPGGFGAVTITKSLTIDCYWQPAAGILAAGTFGIQVNALSTDKVVIRGLEIDGIGTGTEGIRVISAAAVQVDHCRIAGFRSGNAAGIRVQTNAINFELHVKDSHILDSGVGGTGGGIVFQPTGNANVRGFLSRVELRDNAWGLMLLGGGATGYLGVEAVELVSQGNTNHGVRSASTVSGAFTSLFLDRAMISGNLVGASADGSTAQILIGRSSVAQNTTGLSITNSAHIYSYATNQVNGNGSDGAPNGSVFEQ